MPALPLRFPLLAAALPHGARPLSPAPHADPASTPGSSRFSGEADFLDATGQPRRSPSAADLASRETAIARHRIVIVGGGAGGLELAARLGDSVGRDGAAEIILVDAALTHVWKPLLHEVAAGTLGSQENELDFLQQARDHHFRFHLGRLESLERAHRSIWLAPLVDDDGMEVAPRRPLAYDTLVIAVGAVDNDFGTPGAREHAISLNNADEARRFHRRLLALCARAEMTTGEPVHIAIVGGGATGVELAAELTGAAGEIASYGRELRRLGLPLRISLIEAGDRLLASVPQGLGRKAGEDLAARGVDIRVQAKVAEVCADSVLLKGGERIAADLVVWAAGVQGPEVLEKLDGLVTNDRRQLLVRPTLQTTVDDDIFAFGDCASCTPGPDDKPVPPKAQAAQQQALLLTRSLQRRLAGKPPLRFSYRDRGTIVSMGPEQALGEVRTAHGRRYVLRGIRARFGYWLLYRRHLAVLVGAARTVLVTVGHWLTRRAHPRVKLH